jgi:hypothetical protein
VQNNKKVKIDVNEIEVLEKMDSKKLINRKINNIMNSKNKNIRLNNFRKVVQTSID